MQRILIIRFSSFGDIVLTTPVIRCVKQQLPDAEVHFLTRKKYAAAVSSNPNIDKLITIDEDIREVEEELRRNTYDWYADLHHNLRSALVKRHVHTKGAAFPKLNVEKWLMTALKINRLPALHIVDRYFETVREIGVVNDGMGLDFFIDPKDEVDLPEISGGRIQGPFVALAIGAGLPTKNPEDEQWLELVQRLQTQCVLLGGPEDARRGAWLEAESEQCVHLAGKLTLGQSASVIRQASVLIAPDTGLMHIAAALRVPVLSVWGNTIPAFGMTPYYPEGGDPGSRIFEVSGLSCRPCSKIGYRQCPKGHFKCMRLQDLEGIASAARAILSEDRR